MTDAEWDAVRALSWPSWLAWRRRRQARWAAIDAELARREAEDDPDDDLTAVFRRYVAREAVGALRDLGVPRPRTSWAFGIVQTRLWQLEAASVASATTGDPWFRSTMACYDASQPAGEWALWRYATWVAIGVHEARASRRFGPVDLTRADVEEARCALEIDSETWLRCCDRARWMLRDLDPLRGVA